LKPVLVVLLSLAAALSVAASFDDGREAFASQDWKSAAAQLGRFVQENPDDAQAPSAAFLRAVALYQLGDYRASLDGFQKLERTWPRSTFTSRLPYWKGTSALGAGQAALAERELADQSRYPDEQPFATRALLNLALARVALGKGAAAVEALAAFTKASTEAPLVSQAWAVWADEDRRQSRWDAALDHYRRAWEALPLGPWDLSSRTQALDLFVVQGRFAEARELLQASAVVFPGESDRWDDRRIAVYRGLGETKALAAVLESRWVREKTPAAKQAFAANRARLAEESGSPDAGWWLKASVGPDEALGLSSVLRHAYLLEAARHWAQASTSLEQWASAHPNAPAAGREEVRDRAAQDWLLAGDRTQARKSWDRLLTSSPQSARVPAWLLARGRSYLDDGDTVRALPDFTRLLKDFPKAAEAPEARYQTGLVYLKRQEPARAEGWFYGLVQELKSGDLYERALLARGVSFVNSGQTDLARGSLQRLLRETPEGRWAGAAWAALGRNALQARLFPEASEAYTRAESLLDTDADKATALWSRAESLVGAGSTDDAAAAFGRYAGSYPGQPRAAEALYRRGAVWFAAKDWVRALTAWSDVVGKVSGTVLVQTREGMAIALLRLQKPQDGWDHLVLLEASKPSPDSWYRWAQAATAVGEADWAAKAFQYLLQTHPDSSAAEAALPRAAGALLGGGKSAEALDRYADYFRKFGQQSSSAPVAKAAAAAALAYPQTFEALVKASRSWKLAPEVSTEFALAWAQSRLDADTDQAQEELQNLSRTAPWTSQRSEALGILGRWHLAGGRLALARSSLEAAAAQGDDLSVFKARWALTQVTAKEGDVLASARQREALEKSAGPGVPLEFRLQVLGEAADTWEKAGKGDEAKRVRQRIQALTP